MRITEDTRLLTTRQVADILGVCERTVLRYRKAGKLRPVCRLPGGYRFDPEAVEALLVSLTQDEPVAAEQMVISKAIIDASVRRMRCRGA